LAGHFAIQGDQSDWPIGDDTQDDDHHRSRQESRIP
jgi:hypothetical protein